MNVEVLVEAARRGDRWAGPALVTLITPMLATYAGELGPDLTTYERETAIETAVLRSVERLDRFDPERGTFPSWVRGFLRYAVSDVRRKKQGVSEQLVADIPIGSVEDRESDVEVENSPASLLGWELLRLSVTDQVIIALRDFEQLSYESCAERIGGGVTAGACRVRHLRALRRLERLLQDNPVYQQLVQGDQDVRR
jgi:RNA polymerase sigma factor (sigma-70 family)